MPPRVNANAANAANRPDPVDKRKLARLEDDSGDFETFDRSAKHAFYAKGYTPIYDASQIDAGQAGDRHGAATAAQRQGSWGLVTDALGPPLLARVDDIALGETEDLLRRISEQFYRKTIGGLITLRKELAGTRLEDFADIEYYFVSLTSRMSRIERLQAPPRPFTGEEKAYRLMEGLPADYRPVVQTIKTARPPLTWQEMLDLLRDFASDPSVLGTTSKAAKRSNQVLFTASKGGLHQPEGVFTTRSRLERSKEACRDHAKGRCKRGDNCRFSHTATPTLRLPCGYCGMTNHAEDRCFKKQRDERDNTQQALVAVEEAEPEPAQQRTQHEYIFVASAEEISEKPCNRATYSIDIEGETCLRAFLQDENSGGEILTIVDGGATCDIETDKHICYDIRSEYAEIKVGGGRTFISREVGKRKLTGFNGAVIEQTNVRIVPLFKFNIIAEVPFLAAGCLVVKDKDTLHVVTDHGKGTTILQCKLQGNLFVYKSPTQGASESLQLKRSIDTSTGRAPRPPKRARNEFTLSLPRPMPSSASTDHTVALSTWRRTIISPATPDNFPVDLEMLVVSYIGSFFPPTQMTKCGGFAILPPRKEEVPTSVSTEQPTAPSSSNESVFIARSYSPGLDDSQLWHCRLGHRNHDDVAKLLGRPRPTKPCFCKACVEGKSHRYSVNKPHSGPTSRLAAPRPGHTWHSDGIGPFRIATRSGQRKGIIFVDDYTDLTHLALVKSFSALLPQLQELDARLCAEFGQDKVISQLVSDSHTTYTDSAVDTFCRQRGIFQMFSPPYTQALNGKAERKIRTLIEMTRTMMIHAGAPRSLFGEAMQYAVHILNRCPRTFPDGERCTPLERWTGRTQQRAHHSLRVWGCAAWAHDHSQGREKLSAKAALHIFLGIDAQRKCYRLAQLPSLKLVYNAHVIFNESMFPCKDRDPASAAADYMLVDEPRPAGDALDGPAHAPNLAANRSRREWAPSGAYLRNLPDSSVAPVFNPAATEQALTTTTHCQVGDSQHQEAPSLSPGVPMQLDSTIEPLEPPTAPDTRQPSWLLTQYALAACIKGDGPITPTDHRGAMSLPECREWRSAELDEYNAHEENSTFGPPTQLPPGFKAIPTAMVYKIKRGGRYKVRVVVRGYRMTAGIDFNETFAPVARITSIRMLLALAAKYDLELQQADISTAFLAADMDCDVYVTLPRGFNADPSTSAQPSSSSQRNSRPVVHKLLKGVPGIPQGSHLFNKKLHAVLTALNYERLADDYCIYKPKGQPIFLAVWVDDLLLAYHRQHAKEAAAVFDGLKAAFKMHMLGDVNDLLGATVTRDRVNRRISIDQSKPVLALLQKAGFSDCTPVPTPVATSCTFTKAD